MKTILSTLQARLVREYWFARSQGRQLIFPVSSDAMAAIAQRIEEIESKGLPSAC